MPDELALLREAAENAARSLRRFAADIRALGAWTGKQRTAGAAPLDKGTAEPPLERLFATLDAFPGLVGYLNARRSSGSIVVVNSEADVQDLLYLALKPVFPDLVYEEPTKKGAAGYSIGDFWLPCLKLVLEAKYIDTSQDVKPKADEMSQDIWKYSTQIDCQRIVFFVYDPHLSIPDRPNYADQLSTKAAEVRVSGRAVQIQTVIKP